MSGDDAQLDSHHHAPIVGYHRAPLSQKFGAPRQPNLVALTSVIEMLSPYDTPAAFVGLEAFSHIWISWQFHHNYIKKDNSANKNADTTKTTGFRPQVRPPRLGGNQKIGVFASRSMYRPSALGLSVVKLERVEVIQGRVFLIISGADMIDGTPIIDIKPYVAYSDALVEAESGFAPTAPTLLAVTMTEPAYEQFVALADTGQPIDNEKAINIEQDTVTTLMQQVQSQLLLSDIDIIKALIAQDPRPAYRRTQINMPFTMRYKSVDVSFQLIAVDELQITAVVEVM
ncbi:tRNA (N6-threonylcarbamoyladenosine(37)-N6)-methyltransferase TrmO [Psychrobacter sp. SZ93C1]|uniref:tRNA (N6-threonylcarbamoyladenosine(37)-N6)-methyltransferase TrmO n=1 Tax=Psychrobacter sp. SZ93C1 TaxID=2792058 RepID=UPI0018CD5988|nr:tRNA (N6-threonylcarbamoyladenosine(37)-N6)-methyltransferase TrmO [Psychrobacter sp. SZ93C1]MBH0064478.1 tRNA (N6-threonylcarbamoyladenosine(37)-N6)-methyltransferase TrmO [Psychrobacter sp. SZ93C1]